MPYFNYEELSTAQQIKEFYEILERADRDYRYEIDNKYMKKIVNEMWEISSAYTEYEFYDLEYLTQQIEQRSIDHEYNAEELDSLYGLLSSFRHHLLKAHNISMPLFEH